MNEIVVNWTIVTGASVLLGFIINQALAYFDVDLSGQAKKVIVFLVAVGLSGYFAWSGGYELPIAGDDPMVFALALVSLAGSAFKVAQQIYDVIWQRLLKA